MSNLQSSKAFLGVALLGLISLSLVSCGSKSGDASPAAPAASASTTGTSSSSGQTTSSTSMNMDGVVNQEAGFVKNGVYVDKAGKPLCPVLGHEVVDIKGAKFATYKGVKYYFCCESCPKEFAKHPQAYAAKTNTPPPVKA